MLTMSIKGEVLIKVDAKEFIRSFIFVIVFIANFLLFIYFLNIFFIIIFFFFAPWAYHYIFFWCGRCIQNPAPGHMRYAYIFITVRLERLLLVSSGLQDPQQLWGRSAW